MDIYGSSESDLQIKILDRDFLIEEFGEEKVNDLIDHETRGLVDLDKNVQMINEVDEHTQIHEGGGKWTYYDLMYIEANLKEEVEDPKHTMSQLSPCNCFQLDDNAKVEWTDEITNRIRNQFEEQYNIFLLEKPRYAKVQKE